MVAPCIVVANEPRAYREALAHAFRVHYPWVEVVAIEPPGLDHAVADREPIVVVSSRSGGTGQERRPVWITLYPEGEDRAVIATAGTRRVLPGVELADLLAAVRPAVRMG